jgi:hypothetical protein
MTATGQDEGDGTGDDGFASGAEPGWYGVRCVFRLSRPPTYEERITLWEAGSLDDAIAMAEHEALTYADRLKAEYLEIAQAYWIGDGPPGPGTQVFSLMRDSDLDSDDYLDTFYDTGQERQQTSG